MTDPYGEGDGEGDGDNLASDDNSTHHHGTAPGGYTRGRGVESASSRDSESSSRSRSRSGSRSLSPSSPSKSAPSSSTRTPATGMPSLGKVFGQSLHCFDLKEVHDDECVGDAAMTAILRLFQSRFKPTKEISHVGILAPSVIDGYLRATSADIALSAKDIWSGMGVPSFESFADFKSASFRMLILAPINDRMEVATGL